MYPQTLPCLCLCHVVPLFSSDRSKTLYLLVYRRRALDRLIPRRYTDIPSNCIRIGLFSVGAVVLIFDLNRFFGAVILVLDIRLFLDLSLFARIFLVVKDIPMDKTILFSNRVPREDLAAGPAVTWWRAVVLRSVSIQFTQFLSRDLQVHVMCV